MTPADLPALIDDANRLLRWIMTLRRHADEEQQRLLHDIALHGGVAHALMPKGHHVELTVYPEGFTGIWNPRKLPGWLERGVDRWTFAYCLPDKQPINESAGTEVFRLMRRIETLSRRESRVREIAWREVDQLVVGGLGTVRGVGVRL